MVGGFDINVHTFTGRNISLRHQTHTIIRGLWLGSESFLISLKGDKIHINIGSKLYRIRGFGSYFSCQSKVEILEMQCNLVFRGKRGNTKKVKSLVNS